MSKPIVVGYDPATADRAPVNFGVAAARFTGAPLMVASGPDHEDDREPVARWENEGGACDERDAAARPEHSAAATQDGHATAR